MNYKSDVKDPGHSAKSAGGRLHLNTHALLTQRSQSGLTLLSGHGLGTCQGNKLARNSPRELSATVVLAG